MRSKKCEYCDNDFEYTKLKRRFCSLWCARHSRIVDPFQKFFSYIEVDPISHCWNWTGHIHKTGYAVYRSGLAHRFSLEQAIGQIPEGLMALHTCDNRKCVNPKHLFPGTAKDNMDDMYAKGRNRHLRGEEVTNSKLTPAEVLAIRRDPRGGQQIAYDYKISTATVYNIKAKKAWNHV